MSVFSDAELTYLAKGSSAGSRLSTVPGCRMSFLLAGVTTLS